MSVWALAVVTTFRLYTSRQFEVDRVDYAVQERTSHQSPVISADLSLCIGKNWSEGRQMAETPCQCRTPARYCCQLEALASNRSHSHHL